MKEVVGFPRLVIDLKKLNNNASQINNICKSKGIEIAGVIKGCTGLLPCSLQYMGAGCRYIASSRLEQLALLKEAGCRTDLMMIRIPMLSEAEDVVRICEYSLNSTVEVLAALNDAAERQEKLHKVILMADIGDLREGWWDSEELISAAVCVERQMKGLYLAGIGTNVGCYGSVLPTESKLQELVDIAVRVEKAIGRKLEIISGGATTSLSRLLDGDMPRRINMLRVGEGILLSEYLVETEGYRMDYMYRDAFVLQAEVVSVRGDRAFIALEKWDYGQPEELILRERGLSVAGASENLVAIDISKAERRIGIGDIIDFDLTYATIVYVSGSPGVKKVYI